MTTAVAKLNHDIALAGPVGSLDAYIQAVGSVPVLSKEDEQALAHRFRDEDDLDAQLGDYKDSVLNHDLLSAVSRRNDGDQEWDQNGVDKELDKYLQKKI